MVEDLGGIFEVFAKTGGPAVVTLVVVGYLLWKAGSPLLIRLLDSIVDLSVSVKAMAAALSDTNTEIREMAVRLDHLEREVRLSKAERPAEAAKSP